MSSSSAENVGTRLSTKSEMSAHLSHGALAADHQDHPLLHKPLLTA